MSVVTRRRQERWRDYPLDAVRDAIVNAVAHRDYTIGGADIEILARLRHEATEPGASRNLKKQAVDQEALVTDVAAFRDALRAAAATFDVDSSDGAALYAAPLAGLMRWKKPTEAAMALRQGEPAWSAAARRAKAWAHRHLGGPVCTVVPRSWRRSVRQGFASPPVTAVGRSAHRLNVAPPGPQRWERPLVRGPECPGSLGCCSSPAAERGAWRSLQPKRRHIPGDNRGGPPRP